VGFDGAGNVEEVTGGFVRFADLSLPLQMPRADWVVALEVGEHIPSAFEPTFVRNLHAHNCRGACRARTATCLTAHTDTLVRALSSTR
jgi:hypothetical protein